MQKYILCNVCNFLRLESYKFCDEIDFNKRKHKNHTNNGLTLNSIRATQCNNTTKNGMIKECHFR